MATFKIKDLAVNLSDAKFPDLGKYCRFPTKIACGHLLTKINCKLLTDICRKVTACPQGTCLCTGLGSIPCGAGTDPCTCTGCYGTEILVVNIKDLVINPESIVAVQEELAGLMQAAQTRSAEIEKAMQPSGKAQLGAVKTALQDALKSLG